MKEINIQIRDIHKSYKGCKVLDGIDLDINNQSYISICGKSGAGKSTFMNILGLIESFDTGKYLFNNQLLKRNKDYNKIRQEYIGFIYQSYNLIPKMSCLENILMPLTFSKTNYQDVRETLYETVEKLQIDKLLEKEVNVLSGGEKQRVAIARALIMNPAMIIADEPTGNLDETNKKIVTDILRKENEKGRAIVVITHDYDVARLSNHIYTLENGRLKS